ncbi:MAG: hypothetical protein PHQ98_03345 [Candidatus ainarchaeum sp.]|nr:hypothetical protein [Candidatus ainarchaeum sp.]
MSRKIKEKKIFESRMVDGYYLYDNYMLEIKLNKKLENNLNELKQNNFLIVNRKKIDGKFTFDVKLDKTPVKNNNSKTLVNILNDRYKGFDSSLVNKLKF